MLDKLTFTSCCLGSKSKNSVLSSFNFKRSLTNQSCRSLMQSRTALRATLSSPDTFGLNAGGVCLDPQRFMGKTVYVPHFNRDTVEFASRERDESKPAIKTLLPFVKNITKVSDLENFQDLVLALGACYWLHKVISISLSRFGEDGRCDFSRF